MRDLLHMDTVLELLEEFGFSAAPTVTTTGDTRVLGRREEADQVVMADVTPERSTYLLRGRGWSVSVSTLEQFRRMLEIQAPKQLLEAAEMASAAEVEHV